MNEEMTGFEGIRNDKLETCNEEKNDSRGGKERRQRQKLLDHLLLGSQSRFWMTKSTFGGSVKKK